jgi:hypothetical protein
MVDAGKVGPLTPEAGASPAVHTDVVRQEIHALASEMFVPGGWKSQRGVYPVLRKRIEGSVSLGLHLGPEGRAGQRQWNQRAGSIAAKTASAHTRDSGSFDYRLGMVADLLEATILTQFLVPSVFAILWPAAGSSSQSPSATNRYS